MIIEYKLIREAGVTTTPSWVFSGGQFQNPDDFTMIGTTPNDDKREFYLPDTVISLTRQQLVDRVLGIHHKYPFYTHGKPSIIMTDEEVTEMVINWCEFVGE